MNYLQEIEESILQPFEKQLAETHQSPRFHGEGNVLTHTLMVRDALLSLQEYKNLDPKLQSILRIAALLHDIGKIPATRKTGGEWEAPNHAPTGARMARQRLWIDFNMAGTVEAMRIREAICLLIRYHSFPPHAIDDKKITKLHRIASNSLLVPEFSIEMLCTLAKADILGRKCSDRRELLDKVDLCRELALEEGCLDGCYPFQCALTRHSFLQSREVWKDQQLHDDTWGEVVMLSGLPGTGKDTWIESNLPGTPMISLDDIRNEMGVKPDSEQGMVANIARDRAKELLRAHRPFVWNATNITAQTRSALISIFETYKARTRIVYLETTWATLLAQNSAREAAVPESVIRNMLSKLTLPELHEAHKVEWIAAK